MARWEFPPVEVELDYYAAINELAADNVQPIREQHVVSKVVLKGFASRPDRQRGWHLARFDKRMLRELDPKGLDACGNFVTSCHTHRDLLKNYGTALKLSWATLSV